MQHYIHFCTFSEELSNGSQWMDITLNVQCMHTVYVQIGRYCTKLKQKNIYFLLIIYSYIVLTEP